MRVCGSEETEVKIRILEFSATTGRYSGSLLTSLYFTHLVALDEGVHSNLFSSTYRR